MSLSNNFPSLMPGLNLDFINATSLDPRITFTRSLNTATYFDSSGVLRTALANTPRLDYDPSTLAPRGLLIEEQRTNFFTNASGANGGTIGTGTVSGPDNVLCRTLIPTAGVASFPNITGPIQTFTLSLGQTVDWALSGWFAVGPAGTPTLEPRLVLNVSVNNSTSFTYFELQLNTSNWTVRTKVIPASGTEVSAPTITLFKPGLYRVTWVVRYTQDATGRNNVSAAIQARDTTGSGTYTADGVSGVQYALFQAETGSFVTSTIPTTTTALTRSADVASVNTLAPWYNATEGTMYVDSTINYTVPTGFFPTCAAFNDGTNNNRIDIGYITANVSSLGIVSSGVTQAEIYPVIGTANRRTAGAYKVNDFAACTNGGTVGTDTSGTLPTVNRLSLGALAAGNFLNGYLRRVTYYPYRLTNSQLQALTQL